MLRLNPLMIVINGETNSSFGRVLGFNFTFRENDSTGDIYLIPRESRNKSDLLKSN